MTYNLTMIVDNSTNLLGFASGVNTHLMGGWFFNLLILGVAFVLFTSFYFSTGDSAKSLAGTAFICFVLSLFLMALSLITIKYFFIILIVAALSIAASWGMNT